MTVFRKHSCIVEGHPKIFVLISLSRLQAALNNIIKHPGRCLSLGTEKMEETTKENHYKTLDFTQSSIYQILKT